MVLKLAETIVTWIMVAVCAVMLIGFMLELRGE